MVTDTHLARIFGWTVCLISVLIAVAICWQVVVQHDAVDIDLKEIGFLLFGGLLGRLTSTRHPQEGDAPAPVEVRNPPSDPVPTTDTASAPADDAKPAGVPADEFPSGDDEDVPA